MRDDGAVSGAGGSAGGGWGSASGGAAASGGGATGSGGIGSGGAAGAVAATGGAGADDAGTTGSGGGGHEAGTGSGGTGGRNSADAGSADGAGDGGGGNGAGGNTGPVLTVRVLRDTVLSANATAVKSYDTNVNISSFRQQGILSYGAYQYVSWFNGGTRNAIVARRSFDQNTAAVGAWQWAYVDFALQADADSHNVISMGVSPADGRLHVAIGQHDIQLFYIRTVANGLTVPTWDNSVFGGTAAVPAKPTPGLPGYGAATSDVTYPYFMNATDPAHTLQFAYRTGSSGNGVLQLAEYSGDTWSYVGRFTSATGTYVSTGVSSATRNAYPQGLNYDDAGRLHMAFTWRENPPSPFIAGCTAITNHDLLYIYSDDRGRTWRNSAADVVTTTTPTSPGVAVGAAGLVADAIPFGRDLMNQETQSTDRHNLFHTIVSYVPDRYQGACASNRLQAQPFHLWRDSQGRWTKVEIRIADQDVNQGYDRTKMFFDSSNNLYVVLPDLRIIGARAATTWTDWRLLYDGRPLANYGETIIDYQLTRTADVVSVVYLRDTTAPTSDLHVLDLSLAPPGAPR